MYKALVLMTTLGLTANAAIANTCESQSATLQAEYKIHTHSANSDKTKLLNLWRQPNVVAHEYPQTRITETWEHVQQRLIKPTRYFDAHNRAIEYQPGESVHGKTETSWSYRNQLFSDSLLASMEPGKTVGEGCERSQTFTLTKGDATWTLVWLPELHIARSFKVISPSQTVEWTLTELSFDPAPIDAFFAKRFTYQTTDFADIGDDHTDPFLTKMVHQGFIEKGASGYYNTDGEAIGSGHHH